MLKLVCPSETSMFGSLERPRHGYGDDRNELNYRAEVLNELQKVIAKNEPKETYESLNSRELWGGAGAVWEVNIDNESDLKAFQTLIIQLINLMEGTRYLAVGVKQVRKLFENEKVYEQQ